MKNIDKSVDEISFLDGFFYGIYKFINQNDLRKPENLREIISVAIAKLEELLGREYTQSDIDRLQERYNAHLTNNAKIWLWEEGNA